MKERKGIGLVAFGAVQAAGLVRGVPPCPIPVLGPALCLYWLRVPFLFCQLAFLMVVKITFQLSRWPTFILGWVKTFSPKSTLGRRPFIPGNSPICHERSWRELEARTVEECCLLAASHWFTLSCLVCTAHDLPGRDDTTSRCTDCVN